MKKMIAKTKVLTGKILGTVAILVLLTGVLAAKPNAARVPEQKLQPRIQADTTAKKITPAELKKYAGEYVLQSENRKMDVKVFVEDGKLKVHPEGQNVGTTKFIGDHTFIHFKNADIRLVFAFEKDKAHAITLHQRGNQISGKRKPA